MLKKLFSLASVMALALFAKAEVVQDAYVDFSTMTEYNFWHGTPPEGATLELKDGALTVTNPAAKGNWEFQYFVADGLNLTPGQIYDVEIVMSGSVAGSGNLVFGSWGVGVDNNLAIPAGEGTYKTQVACPTNETIHLCMQTGSYVGTIKVKSVKVSHDTACGPELNALKASNIETKSNPWDNQVYFKLETPLVQGKEYTISVDLYGDAEGKIPIWGDGKKTGEDSNSTQYGVGWGDYIVKAGEWTTTKRSFTADNNLEQFNFCFGSADQYTGTYLYFDNVVLTEKGSDVNLLSNGDFTSGVVKPWEKPGWHSFTLKVETAPAHPEPEPQHPNTVWVGPKKMGWGDGVTLDKALFANVCAGDTLIVKYDTAGDGTFQSIFGGWSGLNIPTYEFGNYPFASNDGNGTVTFILPESFSAFETKVDDQPVTWNVFNMIKENGIVFHGPATLNSVIYIPNANPVVPDEHFYITGDFGDPAWNPTGAPEFVKGADGIYAYTAAQASALKISKAQGAWNVFNGALLYPTNYSGAAITPGEWMAYEVCDAMDWNYEGYSDNIIMPWKGDWTVSINPAEGKMQFTTTTPEPKPVTVYYNNVVSNWDEVYVYMWNANNDNNGAWPGNKMTKGEGTIWSYTFTGFEPAKLIFNNGNGQQTEDLDFEADKTYGDTNVEFYLRGAMNGWGTDAKFETADNVIYTMTGVNIEAGQEFKIANSTWNIAYGYNEPIALGVEYTLATDGGNMTLAETMANGSIKFDFSTGKATFTQGAPVLPTHTVTDVLNNANTVKGTASNYAEYKDVTVSSDAVYFLQAAGGNGTIQLRSKDNNSGIVTTTSGGTVKKITVTYNKATSHGRTLDVYAKNTPYENPADLYGDAAGTKVASLVYDSGEGFTYTYTFEGEYQYIGMRSK
ncbi:MAG: starch-binding protein, partial [Muribaculaceae bacterium]|nr:starch-binding protein [Muribaculaceae bacterium]